MENLCLIFNDNPIARGYLNTYLDRGKQDTKIIYYSSFSSLNFLRKYNFNKNNYYPLFFIKDKRLTLLIKQIECFFSLRDGFLFDMYNYNNLNYFQNISYLNTTSINGKTLINFLNSIKENDFLITHQELVKELLKTEKNFFHIHPGYLPKVMGADGSLHSILNYNELGCSFFKLSKEIDKGPIINRKIFEFKKLKLSDFKNFNNKELYRIWFSFVDPALRCNMLIDCLDKKTNLDKTIQLKKIESTNYYTFMNNFELSNVFKKIFCN